MQFEEIVVFTCGLMDDASPLVNYVYQTFCDSQLISLRINKFVEFEQSESRLKRLGKDLENTNLLHLLYSESVVPIAGFPLQNRYVNWFDHSNDDLMSKNISKVHIPSKHFEFRNITERLHSIKLQASDYTQKSKCSMSIVNPDSEVTESILSLCCEIS